MSYGGGLVHFDSLFRLAEEMLDGGDLVGGDCECLGTESVADDETEIWLFLRGFCAGDTERTTGTQCQRFQVR